MGTAVSVSSKAYTYGTTNNQLVDISPTGTICAGTWNRNTGGGIADYTYCYPPNPLPNTGGLPYAVAYITATADSVTSNPVAVYVHPGQVTSGLRWSVAQHRVNRRAPSRSLTRRHALRQTTATQYELCAPASVTSRQL